MAAMPKAPATWRVTVESEEARAIARLLTTESASVCNGILVRPSPKPRKTSQNCTDWPLD